MKLYRETSWYPGVIAKGFFRADDDEAATEFVKAMLADRVKRGLPLKILLLERKAGYFGWVKVWNGSGEVK